MFELTHYDVVVQYVSYYIAGTPKLDTQLICVAKERK